MKLKQQQENARISNRELNDQDSVVVSDDFSNLYSAEEEAEKAAIGGMIINIKKCITYGKEHEASDKQIE